MKSFPSLMAGVLLAAAAQAGDVYIVTDAQGNRIYTDRPQTLPAQKAQMERTRAAAAEAEAAAAAAGPAQGSPGNESAAPTSQARQAEQARAEQSTSDDRAQRCIDAREHYQAVMKSRRLYEDTGDGQRRYLSSEEIDLSRADAKRTMDEFCGGP
jgi:hypothetical protein